MSPVHAAELLAIAAAYDNRKPDATAAKAWALALDGFRAEDCRDAIVAHYQASTDWIMPAHVIAAVKKARSSRLEDVAISPPPGMDPDRTGDYAKWLAATRRAIADGLEPQEYDYPATRQLGELGAVLRSVPAIEAKPPERTAEHQARLDEARAELAARRPVPLPDEEPEPDTDDTGSAA